MTVTPNYHFTVGDCACIAILDGSESVPLESVIKDLPVETFRQALGEEGYSQTDSTVYFNVLLIQAGGRRMLVDAGWGKGVQRRDGDLLEQLHDEGITPEQIDEVILTHGDVDHIGGILRADGELAFPSAGYVLAREAWNFWSNPAILARWPEFLTFFGRVTLPKIRERVRVADAGEDFLPGFRFVSAQGHRPGHTPLAIASRGEHLLHLADTVGHPLFMKHPEWHWYADFQPAQAEQDKQRILTLAVEQDALVFGPHLPFPGVGKVMPHGETWRWEAREG